MSISGPGLSASFTYDAIGRRVSKTINGVTTAYHYDRQDIAAELQGSAVLANYLRKLCLDEAYVRQTATGNEYYHADALGSTVELSDQVGTSQTTYSYEPFGRTSVVGLSTNPFQFTGRENDGTGMYYYRARYYSPQLERFPSEDPLPTARHPVVTQLGVRHLYTYVDNNPINFRDPLGLDKDDPCIAGCNQALSDCTKFAFGFNVGCIAFCYAGCAAQSGPALPICTRTCAAICTGIAVNIRITCAANYNTCRGQCSSSTP